MSTLFRVRMNFGGRFTIPFYEFKFELKKSFLASSEHPDQEKVNDIFNLIKIIFIIKENFEIEINGVRLIFGGKQAVFTAGFYWLTVFLNFFLFFFSPNLALRKKIVENIGIGWVGSAMPW